MYGYGFSKSLVQWILWLGQLSGAGEGELGIDYRTGQYTLGSNPGYRAALDLLLTLRDEGLILPESNTADGDTVQNLFAQSTFGMYLGGDWMVNSIEQAAPGFTDYAVTRVPLLGVTEPQSFFYLRPSDVVFGEFGISAKSKQPEAAWEWFKFLHSVQVGEVWVKSNNGRSIHPEANQPEYFRVRRCVRSIR
ncbi:MAG: extracellular solute-binding protein [Blastochloris sp.]|nr:extracellular solute-binding protein [Blastochloris sp.]